MTVDDTTIETDVPRHRSDPLGFDRTVPRKLVHRAAVSEVFVTDAERMGEREVCVATQLPPTHAYFGDHDRRRPAVDPLLLLEIARQAGIYGGHLLGIPLSTTMLISGSNLMVTAPDALRPGGKPIGMLVDNTFEVRKLHGKRPRAGYVDQRLSVDGEQVATHRLDVLVMTREHHDAVRGMVREGPIPTTDQMVDEAHPGAVDPALVGRVQPMNVVLADARVEDGTHAALVAPRFGNRALFDHTYDHLPGAVLTEAARQLALLAVGDPSIPVVGLDARFPRFAELDAPVTARTPAVTAETTTLPVTFEQGGEDVATITVTVAARHTGGTP